MARELKSAISGIAKEYSSTLKGQLEAESLSDVNTSKARFDSLDSRFEDLGRLVRNFEGKISAVEESIKKMEVVRKAQTNDRELIRTLEARLSKLEEDGRIRSTEIEELKRKQTETEKYMERMNKREAESKATRGEKGKGKTRRSKSEDGMNDLLSRMRSS